MTEQELKQLAQEYVDKKAELTKLSKVVDAINTEIKTAMESSKLGEVETESGAVVHYGVTKKESLDEAMLLIKLKQTAPNTTCIKTKEYVDMDALESEIYHGDIPKEALDAMQKCKTVKLTPTLTISKAKKSKQTGDYNKELFE